MTSNQEDYLKIIYELGGQFKKISNKDIANNLGISPPSVSQMINKLLKEGLVVSSLYQGVTLTPLGLEKAMEIKRKHLLWEVFLVEKLGYSWEDVNEEAEKLEHVTSPKLEKLLDKFLDYPKFCPHGTPIVNKSKGEKFKENSLYDLIPGKKGMIKRLKDDKKVLEFARKINLKIGDSLELIDRDTQGNSLKIKVNDQIVTIVSEFAENIYIEF